jgi:hypothetical protein
MAAAALFGLQSEGAKVISNNSQQRTSCKPANFWHGRRSHFFEPVGSHRSALAPAMPRDVISVTNDQNFPKTVNWQNSLLFLETAEPQPDMLARKSYFFEFHE